MKYEKIDDLLYEGVPPEEIASTLKADIDYVRWRVVVLASNDLPQAPGAGPHLVRRAMRDAWKGGCTHFEISKMFGVSVRTAKNHTREARDKPRKVKPLPPLPMLAPIALPPLPGAPSRPPADPAQVKALRRHVGLTIRDAAKVVGASKRAWESWEGGHRRMAAEIFDRFRPDVE